MTRMRGRYEMRAEVLISYSSSGSEEEEEDSEMSESECEDSVDTCSSTSRESGCEDDGSGWSESDDEQDDSSRFEDVKEEGSDRHVNIVMRLLRARGDLQELKLVECKAYLRKHGLRLSGTKDECIERIMHHWMMKDGNGETFYPRSSCSSWKIEKERTVVIAEKYSRGTAARLVSGTRKMRSVKRKQSFTATGGVKKQKRNLIRSSQARKSMKGCKGSNKSSAYRHGMVPPTGKQKKMNQGRNIKATANATQFRESSFHSFTSQSETYNQTYSYDRVFASTRNMAHGSSSSSAMANRKQRK